MAEKNNYTNYIECKNDYIVKKDDYIELIDDYIGKKDDYIEYKRRVYANLNRF